MEVMFLIYLCVYEHDNSKTYKGSNEIFIKSVSLTNLQLNTLWWSKVEIPQRSKNMSLAITSDRFRGPTGVILYLTAVATDD